MEQILMASDVNIKTATIEVKVMKIGNRQVTLAVFRQLPSEPIIDLNTGELQGIPWGKVNYHVDCDEFIAHRHLHIVWQKSNELRRSIVFQPWEKTRNGTMPPTFFRQIASYYGQSSWHGDISVDYEEIIKKIIHIWLFPMGPTSQDLLAIQYEKLRRFEKGSLLIDLLRDVKDTIHIWQQSYKQLEVLDQLFIAV